ncbi:hypothetical protein [Vibrio sp. 99-8-1]|uniref:hypothetical protein n=1 Tax=Vibrio sp. 99-8-1 TaxID=2607602 RepID=UPI00149399FE|nr:hypothetical protein [Vibrio sp. 99-8-1]NOI67502.1 hypothetical protein [Vibrio sp. 99-8-1]
MYKILIITTVSAAVMGCSSAGNSTTEVKNSDMLKPEITFDPELFFGEWECPPDRLDKAFIVASKISNTVDNKFTESAILTIKHPNLKTPLNFEGIISGERYFEGDKIYSTINYFNLEAKDDFSQMYYNRIKRPMIERLERENYKFVDTLISLDSVSYSYRSEKGNITNCNKINKNSDL